MCIRVGLHLSILCDNLENDMVPCIRTAKQMGYDGVQLPILHPETFDFRPYLQAKKELAIDYIPAADLTPEADIGSEDPEIRKAGAKRIRKALEAAANLECRLLVGALVEPWGIPKRRIGKDCYRYIVENLEACTKYAERLGIEIGYEGINRYEGRIYNTIEQGLRLCREIGLPNAKIHVDTYHANIEENDVCAALEQAGEKLACMHFSENNRGTPGNGQIDFPAIVKTLKKMKYAGYVIAECFFRPESAAGKTMYIWRPIEESGVKVAEDYLLSARQWIGSARE